MIDGLGFEEVNQSGLSTNLVQTVSGVHTRVVGANVIGTTDVSGLNIFATGSLVAGRLNNANGALLPARAQGGFGARIETGSCTTTSAGFGSAIFNAAFTNTQYFFTAQPGSTSIGAWEERISGLVVISGPAGRGVGSVIFWGAASTPYTWVAIGL